MLLTSARVSVSFVTVRTRAAKTAERVGTLGVQMARRLLLVALVNVGALEPVEPRVPGVAVAHVRPGRVHANRGVGVAMMAVRAAGI